MAPKASVGRPDGGDSGAAEAPAAAAAKAPADVGCHYDSQCKGDRVCVKGECVDAPAATAPPAPAPAP